MQQSQSQAPSSSSSPVAPLFQDDERIRLLFAHVKTMVNDCFHSLYEAVCAQFPEPHEQRARFAKGLQFVCDDMRQNHASSEITRAVTSFPSIESNYKKAMNRFIQQSMGPGTTQRQHVARIECRTFDSFLFELYRRIAASVEMRTCRFFAMTYSEQEVFLKDMLRITMSACVTVIDDATGSSSTSSRAASTGGRQHKQNNNNTLRPDDSVSNVFPSSSLASSASATAPTPEEVQRSFEAELHALSAAAPAATTTPSLLLVVKEHDNHDDDDDGGNASSLSALIRHRRRGGGGGSSNSSSGSSSVAPPVTPTAAASRRRSSSSSSSMLSTASDTKNLEIGVYSDAPAPAPVSAAASLVSRAGGASSSSSISVRKHTLSTTRGPSSVAGATADGDDDGDAKGAASELVFWH